MKNRHLIRIEEINELLKSGQKLLAVKKVMEQTGASLKESKDFIDSFESGGTLNTDNHAEGRLCGYVHTNDTLLEIKYIKDGKERTVTRADDDWETAYLKYNGQIQMAIAFMNSIETAPKTTFPVKTGVVVMIVAAVLIFLFLWK